MQTIDEVKEHCRFVAQGIVDASVTVKSNGSSAERRCD